MKSIHLFTTAFVLFTTTVTLAQTATTYSDDRRNLTSRRQSSQPATGSQYFEERFMPAKVSNEEKSIPVRYNVFTDEFETNSSGEIATLPKNAATQIQYIVSNKQYVFVEFTDTKGEQSSGFMQLVSGNDKVKVYQKDKIILEKEVHPNSSYDSYKAANYKKEKPSFYIALGENGIVPLPRKAKDFSKLFPGKEKQIQDLIKSNKLQLDEPESFPTLITTLSPIL